MILARRMKFLSFTSSWLPWVLNLSRDQSSTRLTPIKSLARPQFWQLTLRRTNISNLESNWMKGRIRKLSLLFRLLKQLLRRRLVQSQIKSSSPKSKKRKRRHLSLYQKLLCRFLLLLKSSKLKFKSQQLLISQRWESFQLALYHKAKWAGIRLNWTSELTFSILKALRKTPNLFRLYQERLMSLACALHKKLRLDPRMEEERALKKTEMGRISSF